MCAANGSAPRSSGRRHPSPPCTAAAHSVFKSAFFTALQALLRERGTGAGCVQQVMRVPLADAKAIHDELLR